MKIKKKWGLILFILILCFNFISAIDSGVSMSKSTSNSYGVKTFSPTITSSTFTNNTNSSSYWGNYFYNDYNMPSILSFAYNHTLTTFNLWNNIWANDNTNHAFLNNSQVFTKVNNFTNNVNVLGNSSVAGYLMGDSVGSVKTTFYVNSQNVNPSFDFIGQNILFGTDYNSVNGVNTYKQGVFKLRDYTGTNDFILFSYSSNANNLNAVSFGQQNQKSPTKISFALATSQTANGVDVASFTPNGFGVGTVNKYVATDSFDAIGTNASVSIFKDTSLGSEMITDVNDRTPASGHHWTLGGGWTFSSNTFRHTFASGTLTLPNANIGGGGLKANKWYKLTFYGYDGYSDGVYLTTTTAKTTQVLIGLSDGSPILVTWYFQPNADNVPLEFSSSGSDITMLNFSLKEIQAGDMSIGGNYYGNGLIIGDVNQYFSNDYVMKATVGMPQFNFTNFKTIDTDSNFSVKGSQGITKTIQILKDVDLIGLTKTYCNITFNGGIVNQTTC